MCNKAGWGSVVIGSKKNEMCKSMGLSRLDLNFKVRAWGDGKLFWPVVPTRLGPGSY